jgi:aspartyl-tRNA(Asn)/glutamyl-tRNA(Gln) amidotransferase subunit A
MHGHLPSTLIALRRQILSGARSVSEALQMQRHMLANASSRWNCVTHIFPAGAAPESSLPLAGVGLAHKDIFAMRGRLPMCGSNSPIARSGRSAAVMHRLAGAGSEPLAALGMAEFACGVTGENPNLPLPVNPLDATAAVGGSSSGSGVAVAAGLCYGSLCTDTAGSVRIPAATCGVLGLKTTAGLLPATGTHPLAASLDTIGVMARSALDAAQIFAATLTAAQRKRMLPDFFFPGAPFAPPDSRLETGLPAPESWRIAYCFSHPEPACTPSDPSASLLYQCVKSYAKKGTLAEVSMNTLPELIRCTNIVLHVEAAAIHGDALHRQAGHGADHADTGLGKPAYGLSDAMRRVVLPGAVIPALWYRHALSARRAHARAFIDTYFRGHDILLTPVLPQGVPDWAAVLTHSPQFQPRVLLGMFSWMAFVNYLGLPAIVCPIGHDDRGRPVCIQAIARPHAEALLLAFAHEIERERFGVHGFIKHPPALRAPFSS